MNNKAIRAIGESSRSKEILLATIPYVIPSVLALIAAVMATRSESASVKAKDASYQADERLRSIQHRLDERDLIFHENNSENIGIPVGNDAMWREYYDLVTNKGIARKEAAKQILKNKLYS